MLDSSLFVRPQKLSLWSDPPKAYRLAEYPHLNDALAAPLAYRELMTVSRFLPTAWIRREDGRFAPICLLGLSKGNSLVGELNDLDPTASPLVLKAYPLGAVDVSQDRAQDRAVVADDAPVYAEAEGKILLTPDGELTALGFAKYQALQAFLAQEAETAATCDALAALDAFQAWKLQIRFADESLPVQGLFTIDPAFFSSSRYEAALGGLGGSAMAALEAHMASKARLSALALRMRPMIEGEAER